MKKITITLDDAIARRARIEAKGWRKSLSQYVHDLIEREIEGKKKSGLELMEEFLSGPLLSEGTGPSTKRQDVYDERIDELVRRYQPAKPAARSPGDDLEDDDPQLTISKLATKVRKRNIRSTGAAMKNVTITLDDTIAMRARDEASRRRQSLSVFVGELIERALDQKDIGREDISGLEAIERFLSGPHFPATDSVDRLPTRQEIYDERIDELVRRYERANLRDR